MVEIKTIRITPTIKIDYETYMEIQKAAIMARKFIINTTHALFNVKTEEVELTMELELEW